MPCLNYFRDIFNKSQAARYTSLSQFSFLPTMEACKFEQIEPQDLLY